MTQHTPLPPPIHLTSITHRKYTLTPVSQLAPSLLAVTSPIPPTSLALKTIILPDAPSVKLVLADFAVWKRAHAKCPERIVCPLDLCLTDAHTVHVLMELCPGGALVTARRPERAALRLVACMAEGVEAVLQTGQPAHATISPAHVLFDGDRNPKLSGFGITRARRLNSLRRAPSERGDVRALAALLFELLFGRRYEAGVPVPVPQERGVSRETVELLEGVLGGKLRDVPELCVFRYDVAAARRLVPVCTAPLKPLASGRSEMILGADLDSVRGLDEDEGREGVLGESDGREVAVREIMSNERRELAEEDRRRAAEPEPVKTAMESVGTQGFRKDEELDDETLDGLVRRVAAAQPSPPSPDDIQSIVTACSVSDEAPEKIFKVLFTLPISKNPVVAYKAATLLHHLLAEGPATVTALAITHDGFLKWMETSWARERLQGKAGKTHMMTYCFAAGEIAMYTAALRKRIDCQRKFAQVLSTHWVPRPDGLAKLQMRRREAFGFMLEIIEKCGMLLRKILGSRDPMASLKQGGAPILTAELAKCYHVSCWLFATGDQDQRSKLTPEFSVAHNVTRATIKAVRAVPEIATACPSNSLLELEEVPPGQFDVQALTVALKNKKNKKKKANSRLGAREKQSCVTTPDNSGTQTSNQVPRSGALDIAEGQSEDDDEKVPTVGSIEKEPRKTKKIKSPARRGARSNVEEVPTDNREISNNDKTYTEGSRERLEGNRMAKLSLSVRYGSVSAAPQSGNGNLPQPTPAPVGNIPPRRPSVIAPAARPGYETHPNVISTEKYVPGANPKLIQHDDRLNEPSRLNGHSRLRGSRGRSVEPYKPSREYSARSARDSDSESSEEGSRKITRDRKQKGRRTQKLPDSDESTSGEEERLNKPRKNKSRKPTSKEAHVNEKNIPFDKDPPKKKKSSEKRGPGAGEEDYSGGSKEALAAAASGQKTPNMNPKFEVAPYEVQFGPQVGSGGFGVVFKAKFRNETVAVKKIHGHALTDAASVAEFQSEVAVLCTLRHPNILRFVGACTKPPHLMIITEFMARGTLFDVLHQSQMRVTWPMRKKFALDTCRGMRYLHDSKLLHRDLKSSNLMLDNDFNCKVGDFGLTRISKGSAAVQMTGQCGTFQYMAVEVLANKPYSEKADVFSFGILLWEMVARKLPYFGMQPMQVGLAVMQQGMRPTIPPKCPQPLAKLMRACWDNEPNRRPSFAQLVQALEAMPE